MVDAHQRIVHPVFAAGDAAKRRHSVPVAFFFRRGCFSFHTIFSKLPARAHCHFVIKPSGFELLRAVNTRAAARFRLHALSDTPAIPVG
jgi:hypothetical protein